MALATGYIWKTAMLASCKQWRNRAWDAAESYLFPPTHSILFPPERFLLTLLGTTTTMESERTGAQLARPAKEYPSPQDCSSPGWWWKETPCMTMGLDSIFAGRGIRALLQIRPIEISIRAWEAKVEELSWRHRATTQWNKICLIAIGQMASKCPTTVARERASRAHREIW